MLIGAGPLVGYWGMTTRPDVWALALEILAVFAFWRLYGTRPVAAVLVFCVLAYLAWAFKQSNVAAVGAVGCLLLVRQRWRDLALLVIVMVGAWVATLGIGSEAFRTSVLLREYTSINTFGNALRILMGVGPKILPLAAGGLAVLALVLLRPAFRRGLASDDAMVFAATGLICAAGLAFITSRQPGAAENYYFTTTFFVALLVLASARRCARASDCPGHWLSGAVATGWGLQAVALAAVLGGAIGTTSVRHFDTVHRELKSCLDKLPRPMFVDNHYLSLPWMTPGNPSYVLAFGYPEDRQAGRDQYKGDGIGGKISRGEFAALAFTNDPGKTFDGAALTRYRKAPSDCKNLVVYLKRPAS